MSEKNLKHKKLHVYKEDPNGDKEDVRPIEKRKKPKFSISWKELQEMFNFD